MNFLLKTAVISLALIPVAAQAASPERYNLAVTLGEYIGAAYGVQALTEVGCGDMLVKQPPTSEAIFAEAKPYFHPDEMVELRAGIDSIETQKQAQYTQLLQNILESARAKGHSQEAACGVLAGMALQQFTVSREKWLEMHGAPVR